MLIRADLNSNLWLMTFLVDVLWASREAGSFGRCPNLRIIPRIFNRDKAFTAWMKTIKEVLVHKWMNLLTFFTRSSLLFLFFIGHVIVHLVKFFGEFVNLTIDILRTCITFPFTLKAFFLIFYRINFYKLYFSIVGVILKVIWASFSHGITMEFGNGGGSSGNGWGGWGYCLRMECRFWA